MKTLVRPLMLAVGFWLAGTLLILALNPAKAAAGSYRSPGNIYEQEAQNKCYTQSLSIFGTSWANNTGNPFDITVRVGTYQDVVSANLYSSAFLCNKWGVGTRYNIKAINIGSDDWRLSFSGTEIFRDYRASAGQFTDLPGSPPYQPMGISINTAGLGTGWHRVLYHMTYQDNRGTGYSATRWLDFYLERDPESIIQGRVWDRSNGQGIAGARVADCYGNEAVTDQNGFYGFRKAKGTPYCLDVVYVPPPFLLSTRNIFPWAPDGYNDPYQHGYHGCAPRTFCDPTWRYDWQAAGVYTGDGYDRAFDFGYDFAISKPYVSIDRADCIDGIQGSASENSSRTTPNISLYMDGPRGSPNAKGPIQVTANPYTDGRTGQQMYSFSASAAAIRAAAGDFYNGQDHAFYAYASADGSEASTGPAIMGGCGNFKLSPSSSGVLSPTSEAPTQYNVMTTVGVSYPGWVGAAPTVRNSNDATTVTRNGQRIAFYPNSPQSYIDRTYNYSIPVTVIRAGERYCTEVATNPTEGIIDRSGNIRQVTVGYFFSIPNCATLKNEPIFKVLQSGVRSGGDYSADNPACNSPGILASWFNYPSGGDRFGASTQLSALGLSRITGVASGQNQAGNPTALPDFLSFANSGVPVSNSADSPALGGLFGGTHCLYYPEPRGTPQPIPGAAVAGKRVVSPGVGGGVSGSFSTDSDLILMSSGGPGNIGNDKQVSYFSNGDIYIAGSMTYRPSPGWSYNSPSDNKVPSLVVRAKGNIYIDAGVTNLDGLYIAGKRILTCAKIDPTGAFQPVAAGDIYSACNKQLTIHGVFVAKTVNLMRSLGSLRNDAGNTRTGSSCGNNGQNNFSGFENGNQNGNGCASGCSNAANGQALKTCTAEVFDFSPELYLSTPAIAGPANAARGYDAVSNLPPVL